MKLLSALNHLILGMACLFHFLSVNIVINLPEIVSLTLTTLLFLCYFYAEEEYFMLDNNEHIGDLVAYFKGVKD